MRHSALPIALLLILGSATPALAGAGLPKIAALQAGPHQASLHSDSLSARVGANALTLEIGELPEKHSVSLSLKGPNGETLMVPLKPVTVLGGPEEGHGGDSGGHEDKGGTSDPGSVQLLRWQKAWGRAQMASMLHAGGSTFQARLPLRVYPRSVEKL